MDAASLLAAASEAENHGHSETLFIVMGLILALFAVIVSVLGLRAPNLSEAATRGITMLGLVLGVLTMAAMVVIST
jgi:hypothetical protein